MIPCRTILEISLGSLQPTEQPVTRPFEDAVEIKLFLLRWRKDLVPSCIATAPLLVADVGKKSIPPDPP
jgi:hypothetical protein